MPKSPKPRSRSFPPSEVQASEPGIQPETGPKEFQSNKAKTAPLQAAALEPQFHPAAGFASVYANHLFFAPATIWDFRIIFGEVTGTQDKNLVVENRVCVTMPLEVAKLLAIGIEENLRQYEKATGKTVDIPGVVFAPGSGGLRVAMPPPRDLPEQK